MSRPPSPSKFGAWLTLILAAVVSMIWPAIHLAGVDPGHGATALLAGVAILGSAFMLAWSCEVAELDLPTAFAVSILALVAVLPEYAVDATFAWKAAHDPVHGAYAVANMTGGNRLLLGVGWSMLVFVGWARYGWPGIRLPESAGREVAVLTLASIYPLVPVLRGELNLVDTAVLVSLFGLYTIAAIRGEEEDEEEELIGPAAIIGSWGKGPRRIAAAALLVWSAFAIYFSAEPFADALVETGRGFGIDQFLLVQWVAPLASESPEFLVAALMVWRGHPEKGMLALVSSEVNQFTVLVGTLPVVTSLSAGTPSVLHLDERQTVEVLLTCAQSAFGVAVLANLFLSRIQAIMLFVLFIGQMLVPDTHGRMVFGVVYLVFAAGTFLFSKANRTGLVTSCQTFGRAVLGLRKARSTPD